MIRERHFAHGGIATIAAAVLAACLFGWADSAGADDPKAPRATIIFSTKQGNFSIDSDGGNRRRVKGPRGELSPNGKTLVRVANGYRRRALIASTPEGKRDRVVYSTPRKIDNRLGVRWPAIYSPVWSKADGRIYFVYLPDRYGRSRSAPRLSRVLSVRPDGEGLRVEYTRKITTPEFGRKARPEPMSEVDISPDGRHMLVNSFGFRDFPTPIDVVDLRTGKVRNVVPDGSGAKWSPDGSHFLFLTGRDRVNTHCTSDEICFDDPKIYTARKDGSSQKRLVRPQLAGAEYDAEWSPDGSHIVFAGDRNAPDIDSNTGLPFDSFEIYSIGTDGKCLTLLTNGSPASFDPQWGHARNRNFSPSSCGHTDREPRIDMKPPKYANFWLGAVHSNMIYTGGYERELLYRDCTSYFREDCLISYAMSDSSRSVCSAFQKNQFDNWDEVTAVIQNGALVVASGGRSGYAAAAQVYTGNQVVPVTANQFSYRTKGGQVTLNTVLAAAAAVRPVGADLSPLSSPVLDARLPAFIEKVKAAYAATGSAEKTAEALEISPDGVTNYLKIGEDLKAAGPIPTINCR